MNYSSPFHRLLSAATALILESPLVVAPIMYAVKLPSCKANPMCLTELDTMWLAITAADMQAMIDAGAYVNATGDSGWTPLHIAASFGNAKVIPVLIKAGADVNAMDDNGATPLHTAAIHLNPKVIPVLVKAGAYVNPTDKNDLTPLDWAKREKHWTAAKELEKIGGKSNFSILVRLDKLIYLLQKKVRK